VVDRPLKITEISHTFKNGGQDAFALSPNETVVTDVKVQSAGAGSASVAVALYDGKNRLKAVSTDTVSFTGAAVKSSKAFETALPGDIDGYVLKVLSFEDFDSIKPLPTNAPNGELTYLKLPLTVYLVSDSLCEPNPESAYPRKGWGQYIDNYFADGVNIENRAVGGRSTKTFINEGRWADIKGTLKAGDYVFVSMGTNDQYIGSPDNRETTEEEFAANLKLFADEARAVGANIVFITPIPQWSATNPSNNLNARSDVMRVAASANKITLLDVNAVGYAHFAALGGQVTADTYFLSAAVWAAAGKAGMEEDLTHLNTVGADYIARTIAELLSQSGDQLKSLVTDLE
jgi:lysophospholipase L1-like esterase